LTGYAIAFKKRFYLSGQVNRLKKIRKGKLVLQIGYSHKVRIRTLKYFKFRRWRRKKFGLLIKANDLNKFAAFIDFFRHLRLRGQYTNRGIRLRRDRFKMKFRPDHGKYGFKMNY
jgi:ribosomal protein L6P/L9E